MDARLILKWRNDPMTLKASFHTAPKAWETFWKEYQRDYFSVSSLPCFFVLEGNTPVSFVRFRSREFIDISIIVAPTKRGTGIGVQTLMLAKDFLRERDISNVVAEIRTENTTSIRCFEKAGFSFMERAIKTIDTGEEVPVVRYRCEP